MSTPAVRRGRPTDAIGSTPVGITVGIGATAVVGATMLASAIPAADGGWRFAIVAATLGVFAALTRDGLAVAGTVVLAWLLVDGFLVDRSGELSWHGPADGVRTVMLVLAGALGQLAGHGWRLRQVWLHDRQVADELLILVNEAEEERRGA